MTTFRLFLVFPNQIVQFLPQINEKNINLLPGCKLTTYLLWVHSLNHWTKALTEFLFVIYYAIDSVKIGFVDLVPGLLWMLLGRLPLIPDLEWKLFWVELSPPPPKVVRCSVGWFS